MSSDTANFYARLASAIDAEDRQFRATYPDKPKPPTTMTLEDLKKRATAAELTLIEATIAATRKDAVEEIRQDLVVWTQRNMPDRHGDLREWSIRLGKHLSTQTP